MKLAFWTIGMATAAAICIALAYEHGTPMPHKEQGWFGFGLFLGLLAVILLATWIIRSLPHRNASNTSHRHFGMPPRKN